VTETNATWTEVRRKLSAASTQEEASSVLAAFLSQQLELEQIRILSPETAPDEVSIDAGGVSIAGHEIRMPLVASDIERQQLAPLVRERLLEWGVRSYVLVPVFLEGSFVAVIQGASFSRFVRLRPEVLGVLEIAAELLALHWRRLNGQMPVASSAPLVSETQPSREHVPDDFYTDFTARESEDGEHLDDDPADYVSQDVSAEVPEAEDSEPADHEPQEQPLYASTSQEELWQKSTAIGGAHTHDVRERATPIEGTSLDQRNALYRRIMEFGEILIVRAEQDLSFSSIEGDTLHLIGLSQEEIVSRPRSWQRLVRPQHLHELFERARMSPPSEFSLQIEVAHAKTAEPRWLLVRGFPATAVLGDTVGSSGWEGFILDITAQRLAEEQSKAQGKRIEALYEVARSLELNLDPSVVALKGLRALLKATSSECGFGGLVDASSGQLEVVAAEGLSSRYIEEIGKIIGKKTLAHDAVERREGVLLQDIQQEPRAAVELAKHEGLHATIIMPLVFEEHVLGVMVLFRRDESRYSNEDYDLVSAACSQIALAARQAELFAAEKRQSSSLSALYRLSHELSKQMTLKEVAEHAFPAIQEEIACKRMWLGVMNNRGSHLTGTGGVGPGIRKHLIDLQIELNVRGDFLDQAIAKRTPVVVDPRTEVECGDLGKVLARLNCGTIVVVPLVSLGQVVGVLVVEPAVPSGFFVQRKLPLLNSMATEIATVILARKFEARMADADKMRMAGLLASGVAHNFNNLLQAVMGQASLIEMQASGDARIVSAAKMIAEASTRGAALVKQLFSFSMQGGYSPETLTLKQFLLESRELYRSILGSPIALEYDLAEDCPQVVADSSQMQQVVTNLLMNSKEALEGKSDGKVKVVAKRVRVRSGEVDPELAPGVYLRVEVEDNGAGMTPESLARCFEPFFTTKNADTRTGLGFGGSGLGLSSAYSIMKQHDGVITARSQLGRGTTFSLYLPAVVQKTAELSQGDPESRVRVISNVVLFEIDHAIAFSLRASVEAPGTIVSVPVSRDRVVQLVGQMQPEPAVLVMDLDRVGVHAEELVAEVLKKHSGARVLAYVANMSTWEERLKNSLSEPTPRVRLFEKPLRIWSMTEHIRQALEKVATSGGALRLAAHIDSSEAEKSRASKSAASVLPFPLSSLEKAVEKEKL
jgi:signal transduction histidine kinase/PAS domain-containing protein